MIPTLKEEEKAQIMAWLVEAREFAMDAENSNKKHAAFGKYKGRPVMDVVRHDPGYYAWIMQGDFPQNTKQTFMRFKLQLL